MEFLIITGMSGAGKTRAADICEDLNYYCVDNLPVDLLPQFADLCRAARGRYEKAAVVMDVRSVPRPDRLGDMLQELLALEGTVRVLYLEADTDSIIRRYKESRRPHPLGERGIGIERAIAREAELLAPFRERADLVINTTGLSLNQLKSRIAALLEPDERPFSVNITSFGYKLGLPPEADIVLDVRCLANPYYEDDLRTLTGLDAAVSEYVFRDGTASELMERFRSLVAFLVPLYEHDRQELNIAVGCTGGHHRSVAVAQALGDALERDGLAVNVSHRDMERA